MFIIDESVADVVLERRANSSVYFGRREDAGLRQTLLAKLLLCFALAGRITLDGGS